jgi:hypothetical protein
MAGNLLTRRRQSGMQNFRAAQRLGLAGHCAVSAVVTKRELMPLAVFVGRAVKPGVVE